MALIDTPWIGYSDDKLYLQSGQFTSTLKTSQFIRTIDEWSMGISFDGTNTPWIGDGANKLFLQSGQFTSTIKTSYGVSGISTSCLGISFDGVNTPWNSSNRLYLQSGQFSSTLKTSQYVGVIDTVTTDISFDGTNTPWSGDSDDKLYLQSGQFTSTLKTSQDINSIDTLIQGISFDGTNTPWTGDQGLKLYLQSGQFSSVIKISQSINNIDIDPRGISTNNVEQRLGFYFRSIEDNLSLDQIINVFIVYPKSITSTLSFDQVIGISGTRSIIITNNLLLNSGGGAKMIYSRSLIDNLFLNQAIFAPIKLNSILVLNDQISIVKKSGLELCQTKIHWPRWIFASASKYFEQIAQENNLHFFIEGTERFTSDYQKYIEFRLDGPNMVELSKDYYRLEVEINLLWSFNQDQEDFHETERIKGILIEAMTDICIYKYGNGASDDNSLLGVLSLKQDNRNLIRVNNFGQIRQDVKLMQGTVEGTYLMELSC